MGNTFWRIFYNNLILHKMFEKISQRSLKANLICDEEIQLIFNTFRLILIGNHGLDKVNFT